MVMDLENILKVCLMFSGGAKLGGDVNCVVNILPNDSPSGMFGFTKSSLKVKESNIPNDEKGSVNVTVRRFQGSE